MTGDWSGAIFKYYPSPVKDDFLYDSGEASDPDFSSNTLEGKPLPVWAICGVIHRRDLPDQEGTVFFVPAQKRWKETGLDDYICTGILVTSEKIPHKNLFLQDIRFNKGYLERYLRSLPHPKDKRRIKRLREHNIIIGDQSRSVWFGRNSVPLRRVLKELRLSDQAEALDRRNPSIPRLTFEESKILYSTLTRRIKSIQPLPIERTAALESDLCACGEDEE